MFSKWAGLGLGPATAFSTMLLHFVVHVVQSLVPYQNRLNVAVYSVDMVQPDQTWSSINFSFWFTIKTSHSEEMGIASASFNHGVYCNEPEPVVVVKRVAGHCIVMNCIVSPRYQSPPAYLVAAPRPRSSDGPARCLLTVNKTNFGIINIFVSPSPSSLPLPI